LRQVDAELINIAFVVLHVFCQVIFLRLYPGSILIDLEVEVVCGYAKLLCQIVDLFSQLLILSLADTLLSDDRGVDVSFKVSHHFRQFGAFLSDATIRIVHLYLHGIDLIHYFLQVIYEGVVSALDLLICFVYHRHKYFPVVLDSFAESLHIAVD
jgi:hypothetical protein